MPNISNESSNKKRLGRGLGSLLGGAQSDIAGAAQSLGTHRSAPAVGVTQEASVPVAAPETNASLESRVWQVAIEKLQPGKFQPRTNFEKEKIEELAQSIKENGILQPIVARRVDGAKLEIIAGERRWRAAQLAGLKEVPVVVRVLKNQQALELAIIENIQREDLGPLDQAEAFQRLISEFAMTQQQVAEKVGKDRATVANAIRLLNLSPEIRKMLINNEISAGHAKVLLGIEDPGSQLSLAKKIASEKMSVRQAEKHAANSPKRSLQKESSVEASVTQRLISGLAEELQKIMGTKVNIDYSNSKGKISVHFYSDEELTQIIERLKSGCQQ